MHISYHIYVTFYKKKLNKFLIYSNFETLLTWLKFRVTFGPWCDLVRVNFLNFEFSIETPWW